MKRIALFLRGHEFSILCVFLFLTHFSNEILNKSLIHQTDMQLEKSKRSLRRLIEEHQEKLGQYKKQPELYDNRNFLKNNKLESIKNGIKERRIEGLEKEIATFTHNIGKIERELMRRKNL